MSPVSPGPASEAPPAAGPLPGGTQPVPHWRLTLALLALLLFARQPGDLLQPQLYAEEGAFFQRAFNEGFGSTLLAAHAGYYHLSLTLTAGLALLVPLELVPLVFKAVAFAIQMLPVAYLLADGVAGFVGRPLFRIAAAALYVAAPNATEVYLNLTNAQWHLTVAACLILLSGPRVGRLRMIADTTVLTLFALSGPFSLVCAPLALWSWRRVPAQRRNLAALLRPAIVVAGGLVQAACLAAGQRLGDAASGVSSLSVGELVRILAVHVTFNSFLGMYFTWRHVADFPPAAFTLAAAAILLPVVAVLLLRNAALTVLGGLAAASVAVMFLFPLNDLRQWLEPFFGPRYYFFATLTIVFTLLALAERPGMRRWIALPPLLVVLGFGVRADFRIPPAPDTHWRDQVTAFRGLPEGSSFFVPIGPQPTPWGMNLVKRSDEVETNLLDGFDSTDRPVMAVLHSSTILVDGHPDPLVVFRGFASDPASEAAPSAVFVEVDGRVFPAVTGFAPQNVPSEEPPPLQAETGYYRLVPQDEIGPGVHRATVWALDHSGTFLLLAGPELQFTLPVASGS